MKNVFAAICLALLLTSFVLYEKSVPQPGKEEGYVIDTLMENLNVPWQIVFLPDQTMLFTERAGRVRIYRNQKLVSRPAFIADDVVLKNKTGVLGLCIHPDFSKNNFVFLATNYLLDNLMKLRIVRYEFKNDTLVNPFVILKDLPANQNHTGCRLLFGPDRKLYITTGDADQPALAQDLKAYNGKILRFNEDGTIPADNPFVKSDSALKEIWSYGHRNPQGISFQRETGLLFSTEHGPTGGDEINIIKKGHNYGWPIIHHKDTHEGMETPLSEFTPSIGPAEAMFYYGKAFPELQGNLLVGCLRGESILRVILDKDKIVRQEVLFKKQYGRIRSIVTGPDGNIYFSTSQNDPPEGVPRAQYDMILRLKPGGKGVARFEGQKFAVAEDKAVSSKQATPEMIFKQLCASCHGDHLQGTEKAKSLNDGKFKYGSDKSAIVQNITNGIADKGMPAWKGAISSSDIDQLAEFIVNKQSQRKDNRAKN